MESKSLEGRVTLLENELRGLPTRVGALEIQVTAVAVQLGEEGAHGLERFRGQRGRGVVIEVDHTSLLSSPPECSRS